MNGGIRYTNLPNGVPRFPPQRSVFASTPCLRVLFVSITPMAPSTRTSVTCGNRRAGSSFSLQLPADASHLALPVVFGRGQQLHRSARYGACQWDSHKGGSVHKHLRCMVGDGIRHFIRRQYGRQRHVSARYGLPMHMMSGSTPACSQAKSFPVRPKPVAISSNISSRPCSLHICAASRRYWGGRTTCRQRPAPQVRG